MNKQNIVFFKALSVLLIVSMFVGLISVNVVATSEESTLETDYYASLKCGTSLQMLEDRIATVSARTGENLSVDSVKEVYDFSGNLYYDVEFFPTGYLICNSEYGNLIEYSTCAPSPYLNLEGNLFYGGPTYYYIEREDGLSHTFYDEIIPSSESTILSELEQASDELQSQCSFCSEYLVDSKTDINSMNDIDDSSYYSPNKKSVSSSTITYVGSDYAGLKIKNLTTANQMGYYCPPGSNGICGYIASGLLLYWIDEGMGNNSFINDFAYIRGDHNGFINGNLSKELRTYGSSDTTSAGGTSGESLKYILEEYARRHFLNISTTAHVGCDVAKIKQTLSNTSKPVIVTGKLYNYSLHDYQFHVVLAYGYSSNNEVIVHFGHQDYSHVVLAFTGVALSRTYLEINSYSAQTIQINDIPNTNWAFPAAAYCIRHNIIDKNANGTFNPNAQINRGNFIKAIYTLVGKPKVSGNYLSGYSDAPSSTSSLYDSVNWAVSKGILTGINPTTLALGQSLTREQAVTFLYRTSNKLSFSFPDTSGPNAESFADFSSVSTYARVAMKWATIRYLVNGNHGYLYPQSSLTRAEAAQMIYNLSIKAIR